uniref:Uncharacterized protein n=1 Tax=Branchiostoma floridae TaxID=7739 RepID=C3YHF4_BRAFL|eukprot:XP_002604379.1 hypothetical protein BRAFLDRAFT_73365 [Branchiostoma floridae]
MHSSREILSSPIAQRKMSNKLFQLFRMEYIQDFFLQEHSPSPSRYSPHYTSREDPELQTRKARPSSKTLSNYRLVPFLAAVHDGDRYDKLSAALEAASNIEDVTVDLRLSFIKPLYVNTN